MKKFVSLFIVLFLVMALLVPATISAPATVFADEDPNQCSEICMDVVSNATVLVTKGNVLGPAVAAWEPFLADPNPPDPNNSFWDEQTGNFFTGTGADWIWESYRTVHPVEGDVVYFEKTFTIPGLPTNGTLYITCDNGYEVYLNGMLVGSEQLLTGWEASNLTEAYVNTSGISWQSVENYNVLSKLVPGTNVLLIKAVNEYMGPLDGNPDGTIDSNPAGLIFKMHICYKPQSIDCMDVVSNATVSVTKGNVTGYAVNAWEPFLADPNPPDPNNSYWDSHLDYSFTGGADWIWESYRTVHPVEGDIVYFRKTFDIPGLPTNGTLYITCDNGYEVYLNGILVGSEQLLTGWEASNLTEAYVNTSGISWQSVENYNVLSKLVQGTNVLLIKAVNEYMGPLDGNPDGTIDSNPAGLIFQIHICYNKCGCH